MSVHWEDELSRWQAEKVRSPLQQELPLPTGITKMKKSSNDNLYGKGSLI